MPRRVILRNVRISPREQLLIMIFFGMVRSTMNWFSFTWDGNVQDVWNLPGPSPSFSVKYHFDYWLKTILSFVVLFRNFATHFHLLFYVVMLYPVFTGEQYRLMLPWLHLQLLKNIVADIICTVIGVLLSWLLHSRGLLTLEFLFVRIISMMPSIYLWRRLRSYYFELYYAELDGECSLPVLKPDIRLTLAQRRRAAKSLDGTMIAAISSEERKRINSCLTYEEIFGSQDWNMDTDEKISRSLTTLLTIESQESDDIIEEDSHLKIIDYLNLTPAEKTMRILGITKENSDAVDYQINKKTSTNDIREGFTHSSESMIEVDSKFSFVLVTRELNEPSTVGTQVNLPVELKNLVDRSDRVKCACCEESKCSGNNDDEDSEEENIETISEIVTTSQSPSVKKKASDINADHSSREKSSNCCNGKMRNSSEKMNEKNVAGVKNERNNVKDGIESNKVGTSLTYRKKDLYPIPRLQAIVERDGIVWEKLKEINFVSVIDKILCGDESKLFKLENNYLMDEKSCEGATSNVEHFFENSNVRVEGIDKHYGSNNCDEGNVKYESSESGVGGISAEREYGSELIEKSSQFSSIKKKAFYLPTSASFGIGSDILTSNASYVFNETSNSGIQSFDSTSVPTNSLAELHQDVDFDSYFRSTYEEHSNMFNDSKVEFSSFRCNGHSANYGTAYMVDDYSRSYQMDEIPAEKSFGDNYTMNGTSLYDSSQSSRPIIATKENENSSGLAYHRSTNHTPQFQHGLHDNWDFGEEDLTENYINLRTDVHKSNCVSETGTKRDEKVLDYDKLVKNMEISSNNASVDFSSNFSPEKSIKIEKSATTLAATNDLVTSERSVSKSNKLASSSRSSRSSKGGKRSEKWEDKTLKALKAYNDKTLYKYKREMDAREYSDVKNIASSSRQRENQSLDDFSGSNLSTQDKPRSPFFEKNNVESLSLSAGNYGSNFNQTLYVPSAPELDKPEKELILNIEKAYARFTRSKPSGSMAREAFCQSIAAKEFFDLYSGDKNLKKESKRIKIGEEITTRKRHSKYSKFTNSRETDQSDITSRSCKRIEGSQKGRELDKILPKENLIGQEIEVYFLERQNDDKPSSSKNLPITMIKSFSRKLGDDTVSVVSSETLTLDDDSSQLPMIEILENSEDIPCRIDENEYHRELRKNNMPENVREIMKNIDWSFRRPYCTKSERSKEEEPNDTIVSVENRLEHENIVQKRTENMLRCAFANSENSERGFHLSESENEYYPIFNEVAVTVGEILKVAGLRGYRNEFISQPATEIEILEIDDENFYGTLNPREFSIRSSLAEDMRTFDEQSIIEELPSMILNDEEKKIWESEGRRISRDEDGVSSDFVLSKLIVPIESRSVIQLKGVTEVEETFLEQEDTSGDLPTPETSDLEDYSNFLFKGSSTPKKSPTSSKCYNPERSLHVGQKTKINCERVRLALQDVMHKYPTMDQESSLKIPQFLNNEEPQYEFDFESCRRILNHFNSGNKEFQNAIEKVLRDFPYNEILNKNKNSSSLSKENLDGGLPRSLEGSEFIRSLEILSVLNLITTTTDKMINLTENHAGAEESLNSGTEYSSRESNGRSQRQSALELAMSQAGTSSTMGFDNDFGLNNDRLSKKSSLNDKMNVETESNIKSRYSSSDKIDQPCNDDEKQFLPSNISTVEKIVSAKNLEVQIRENFSREVIDSVFIEAIRDGQSCSRLSSRTELERLKFETSDTVKRKPFLALNKENFIAPESHNLINVEPKTNVHRMGDEFLIDDNNVTPDLVLGDIETMESLIRKMKIVFKKFVIGDDEVEKEEKRLKAKNKVSSLTNLSFLVHGEVKKLQRVVQIVANYATITESSSEIVSSKKTAESPSEIKSSYELNNFHVRRKELVSEDRVKDKEKLNSEDHQDTQTPRSSIDPIDPVDRFASWDKMIPLSTKRLIAKSRRKSKPKRTIADREPRKRIVKVIKLSDKKDSDFFSAKFVPQRGRGLSSGYLMDSDSDGNFTISRPLTPASIESEISETETETCDDEDSQEVRRKESAKTLDVIGRSKKMQSTLRRSSKVFIKNSSSLINNKKKRKNFENNSEIEVKISDDEIKSLKNHRFMEKSLDSSLIENDDKNIKNDSKLHVLSAEILLTDNEFRNLSSVDAVRIVNELTNEVKQILIHQFRGVNRLTNGLLPVALKTKSFTRLSDGKRNSESLINIRYSIGCNSVEKIEEQNKMKEDCEKRVKEILKDFIEELIIDFEEDDTILKTSETTTSFESLQRESMIGLRHVATGTEYTEAVLKDLIESFATNNFSKNNKVEGGENKDETKVEKEIESTSGYSDEYKSKIISKSSELDSHLSKSLSENPVGEVKLSFLFDSRKEDTTNAEYFMRERIDHVIIDDPDEINSVNNVLSEKYISELEDENNVEEFNFSKPNFSSYDSFVSLLSQKRKNSSGILSRDNSLSDHTFIEEFTDEVNYSRDSFSQPCKHLDNRSNEPIQPNSEDYVKEPDTEEQRYSKNNSQITSATSISSESNTDRNK